MSSAGVKALNHRINEVMNGGAFGPRHDFTTPKGFFAALEWVSTLDPQTRRSFGSTVFFADCMDDCVGMHHVYALAAKDGLLHFAERLHAFVERYANPTYTAVLKDSPFGPVVLKDP